MNFKYEVGDLFILNDRLVIVISDIGVYHFEGNNVDFLKLSLEDERALFQHWKKLK